MGVYRAQEVELFPRSGGECLRDPRKFLLSLGSQFLSPPDLGLS